MIEFLKNTKIDFMGKRVIGLVLSGMLTLIGIIAIIQIARGEANLGIDFAGGTSVQVKFNTTVQISDVRKALVDGGVKEFDLQMLPTENKALIRIKKNQEKLGDLSAAIISALSRKFSESNVVVDSTTEIGPKVGAKLREDAMWAVIAAMIGILIYVAFRFQVRFGIGATMATFHDVTAVLAVFYLMGKEINLLVISALLMIAGYSLTDTVVVFDRIRENMRSRIKLPRIQVINESINEVLSRTLITSLTTFATALSLFLFGGEVIHDFALAIMLGIIVGTYSSIFVASPIVLMLGKDNPFVKK
ncbi:MAG: protein translocase subunit SecF [Nitrospiraceae bacterium]|nr:MAG: protein translocase subunit SecF [Nitrospiraceae bacterium]